MTLVFIMLSLQVALGGLDNLWHHEITERLPSKATARLELALHAAREALYALIFGSIAWVRWEGLWAWALLAVLLAEIIITLTDFIVEDRTRRLPPLERVLHTVLALGFGATLAVWAPRLVAWSQAPTALAPANYGLWSWAFSLFALGVGAWSLRDLHAVARLGMPQWQRRPMRLGRGDNPRTVLVTGATGFIGRHLVRALLARGDRLVVLSRDPLNARDRFGPLVEVVSDLSLIDSARRIDAVVNLAGEPLAGGLWTARRRRVFLDSRVETTQAVVALMLRLARPPAVLVSGSAIGFYGDRGDETLTENKPPQDIFTSTLCRAWEAAAVQAEAIGVRVCRLRIGLVLGRDGGSLPLMALPVRLGLGTRFGAGRQWMSWIHIADLVRLILFALDEPGVRGPLNAVAPHPVQHHAFMAQLGSALHRPVWLAAPAWLLRRGMGQMSCLFLDSQKVLPRAAGAQGFVFDYPAVDDALAELYAALAPAAAHTAFGNTECPVCAVELAHYGRVAAAHPACGLTIADSAAADTALASYGLDAVMARRRMFTALDDGTVVGGTDAMIALWRGLPGHRLIARLVALPGPYQLAELLYEGLAVPCLGAWNAARQARSAQLDAVA